ncbi:hypothetical protein SDC9_37141 [bioreactor metagenome]|uniref:Uncharacterized protein n=1 Tax=bioreactor metagenome TaxID=1076179 RepID=A0A644VI69_9ZZZZ
MPGSGGDEGHAFHCRDLGHVGLVGAGDLRHQILGPARQRQLDLERFGEDELVEEGADHLAPLRHRLRRVLREIAAQPRHPLMRHDLFEQAVLAHQWHAGGDAAEAAQHLGEDQRLVLVAPHHKAQPARGGDHFAHHRRPAEGLGRLAGHELLIVAFGGAGDQRCDQRRGIDQAEVEFGLRIGKEIRQRLELGRGRGVEPRLGHRPVVKAEKVRVAEDQPAALGGGIAQTGGEQARLSLGIGGLALQRDQRVAQRAAIGARCRHHGADPGQGIVVCRQCGDQPVLVGGMRAEVKDDLHGIVLCCSAARIAADFWTGKPLLG